MNTQCARVVEYLKQHGTITQMDAFTHLGIWRLASRVNDLKNHGVSISKRMVKVSNRYGESCKIAEYSMKGKA